MTWKSKTPIAGDNPFGKWTDHRSRIAQLSREGAGDPEAELEARRLMKAAQLADAILAARDDLTDEQRDKMAKILEGRDE